MVRLGLLLPVLSWLAKFVVKGEFAGRKGRKRKNMDGREFNRDIEIKSSRNLA